MPKNPLKPFYITTTLPYVNAEPHIGHALEFIRADIIARSKKLAGHEVFFNTGTDEHGVKVYDKAKQLGLDPQKYVDQAAAKFKELLPVLGIMPEIHFTRTTDHDHVKAAQEFWKIVDKNGLIYKKNYKIKYCTGCELEKTDSELVDGRCPLHPLQELEIIEEENYFFRFSIFQKQLMDLYTKNPLFVIPHSRLNEIQAFVERCLQDFSISRLKSKMPWGIEVPGDPSQVMYVWFDALVNYIDAIGWPDKPEEFQKWWIETGGVVQYCGKDNLRQQSAMWQAMLMAAKLPPSKMIIVNGFVTGDGGIKMSKSLGNTIEPQDVVKEFGMDALRYYVTRELHPFEDSPFTIEKFKHAYNAHLANGLGNLVSRIMKMAQSNDIKFDAEAALLLSKSSEAAEIFTKYKQGFEKYDLQQASNAVWELVGNTDKIVQEREPFKKIKTDRAGAESDIRELLARLEMIGSLLLPILPETAAKILNLVETNTMPPSPLFVRK
jgi:methionyl-tRNA synthetase